MIKSDNKTINLDVVPIHGKRTICPYLFILITEILLSVKSSSLSYTCPILLCPIQYILVNLYVIVEWYNRYNVTHHFMVTISFFIDLSPSLYCCYNVTITVVMPILEITPCPKTEKKELQKNLGS